MGRLSWVLLVSCALAAFFLPLAIRQVWRGAPFRAPVEQKVAPGQPPTLANESADAPSADDAGPTVALVNWLAPINSTGAVPTAGNQVGLPTEMVFNLVLISLAILTVLGLFLKLGPSWMSATPNKPQLQVCDSLALQRDAYVKLIRVGSERVVVAQDRHGLSMVLLPPKFEKVLDDAKAEDQRRLSARDLKLTFTRPEDNGWDLSQPIS